MVKCKSSFKIQMGKERDIMKNLNYLRKFKGLSFRLFLSFFLLLSLFLVKQFTVQRQLTREENTSETINTAGRQRMLSQKITKDLTSLHYGKELSLRETEENLTEFRDSQEELIRKGKNDSLLRQEDELILKLYQELNTDFEQFVYAGREYLNEYRSSVPDDEELNKYFEKIQKSEEVFLEKMDDIVFTYETEAREALILVRVINFHLFIFIILLLLYAFFRVFLPLMNYARDSYEHMKSLKKDLMKVLKQMKDILFIVNREGEVLFMNKEAKEFIHAEKMREGKKIFIQDILWLNFDMKEYLTKQKLEKKEREEIEILYEDSSNRVIPYSLSSLVGDYDGVEAIVLNLQNLTKQKEAENILKSLATRDELTGLYNRYILEHILEKEVSLADDYHLSLSLAILDLDHFKQVNDQYGHPIGDVVLKETANLVKKNILLSDYAVRIGGEKFLIFMPNTNKEEARKRVENIRKKLEKFTHPQVGVVTASFGLAERQLNEDYLAVYKRVDDALYEAKENGRNQVYSV